MAIPLTAGEHEITLEARLSPLRKILWGIAAMLVFGWSLYQRRSRLQGRRA